MGTVFSFDVRSRGDLSAPMDEAVALLRRADGMFSTYRPDSAICLLGAGDLTLDDCPDEVKEVSRLCTHAARETSGFFDPRWHGRFDPTGLVKGWAIDRATAMLLDAGAFAVCINGGGDVRAVGGPAVGRPWRVGVAHPLVADAYVTVVEGIDMAVATSGTAERGAHVVNPLTGLPATELSSVTVVGRDLALVDAYATAALAMGSAAISWADDRPEIDAFAVTADGLASWTAGFPAIGLVPCP
jgi:thiamine biosynthesis lipoprotein